MTSFQVLLLLSLFLGVTADEAHTRRRSDLELKEPGNEVDQESALDELVSREETNNGTGHESRDTVNASAKIIMTRKLLEEEIEELLDSLKDPDELEILENLDKELSVQSSNHPPDPWNSKLLENQLEHWVEVTERLEQDHREHKLLNHLNTSAHEQNDTESTENNDMKEIEELEKNMTQQIVWLEKETTTGKQKADKHNITTGKQNSTSDKQNVTTLLSSEAVGFLNTTSVKKFDKNDEKIMEEFESGDDEDLVQFYDEELMKKLKDTLRKDSQKLVTQEHRQNKSEHENTSTDATEQRRKKPAQQQNLKSTNTAGQENQLIKTKQKTQTAKPDTSTGAADKEWKYSSHNNLQPSDFEQYWDEYPPDVYPNKEPDNYYSDLTESNYPDDEDYYYYYYPQLFEKSDEEPVEQLATNKLDLSGKKSGKIKNSKLAKSKLKGSQPKMKNMDKEDRSKADIQNKWETKQPSKYTHGNIQYPIVSKQKSTFPDVSKMYKAKNPDISKSYKSKNPDISKSYKPKNPDISKSYKAKNPDISKSHKSKNPDISKSYKLKNPDVSKSHKSKNPDISKSYISKIPDVSKSYKSKNPDVSESYKPSNPDVSKTNLFKSKYPVVSSHKSKYPYVPSYKSKYPDVPTYKSKYPDVSSSKPKHVPSHKSKYPDIPSYTSKYPYVPSFKTKYQNAPAYRSKYPDVPEFQSKYPDDTAYKSTYTDISVPKPRKSKISKPAHKRKRFELPYQDSKTLPSFLEQKRKKTKTGHVTRHTKDARKMRSDVTKKQFDDYESYLGLM